MKKTNENNSENGFLKTAKQCWREDIWLKILSLTSIGLIVTSFFLPPQGVIDPSVMLGVGELTGIGVIWEFDKAMDKNLSAKIKIKETELSISRAKAHEETKDNDIE